MDCKPSRKSPLRTDVDIAIEPPVFDTEEPACGEVRGVRCDEFAPPSWVDAGASEPSGARVPRHKELEPMGRVGRRVGRDGH